MHLRWGSGRAILTTREPSELRVPAREWTNLSELNQFLIRTIATEFLGIKTEFRASSEFDPQGGKQERLLDLVRKSGCHTYISGPAAKDYIEPARFDDIGVKLVWKDYSGYREYPQFFPPFEHRASIIDLLFHTGPLAPEHIWIRSLADAGNELER